MKFSNAVVILASIAASASAFAPSHHSHGRRLSFVSSKTASSRFAVAIDNKVEPFFELGEQNPADTIDMPGVTIDEPQKAVADNVEEVFEKAPTPTKEEVRALFYLWNDALATGDSRLVARRYSEEPTLLPTVSDLPRTDYESVKDYFDAFLLRKPQGKIVQGYIKIGQNWCSDTGIYEFTMGADGSKVKARYSFVYVWEKDQWKISHHHSSVMPEEIALGKAITENEVRDLFHLWNDALATGNPKAVAARYSRKGVLLPTVSDTPRTDYYSILDYFESFLKLQPQGEILESNVMIGHNWCQDAGIYEFQMGATGATVKARYSFVYVYEDGQWKIAHHHSSFMPEEVTMGQDITEDQVRSLFHLWNDALATGDATIVADRYARQGVLLPTVSDQPRKDYYSIVDYFENFLKLKPQGKIIESNVLIGANWAQDAGIYEFTMGSDGSVVRARYTYIYVWEDGQWKISQHHSSVMPEAVLNKQKLTVSQVQDLFHLWNDALATLSPDKVTARYSKNAILLPTVSDTPRTTKDLIRDYFVTFLERKPQGVIVESHVQMGDNWCKDSGLYEFTMGADGSKVMARYTFVYVYEDGEWKISHHHSSVMPEAFLNPNKED